MSHVTDEMLGAYVDGELTAHERAVINHALAADPELQRRLAAQQHLRDALAGHFDPIADEPPPARLRTMLDPADADVVDLAQVRRRRRIGWPQIGALAASLAVGLVAGQLLLAPELGPIAADGDALFARAGLAEALETQLASAPRPGEGTRITLTFRTAEGRVCRTFEAAVASGIACREAPGWRLVATAPGRGATTDYRQAAAPAIAEQAQALMAGAPFDAAAERSARDRGWQAD